MKKSVFVGILVIICIIRAVNAVDEQSVCNFYSDSSCTLYLNHAVGFEIASYSYFLSVEYISGSLAIVKVVNQKNTTEHTSYTLGINSNFSFNNINIRLKNIHSDYVQVGISVISNSDNNETDNNKQSICYFYKDYSCNLYFNHKVGFETSNYSYFLSAKSISRTIAMIKVVNQNNPIEYKEYTLGVNSNFSFNNINILLKNIHSDYVQVGISVISNPPVDYGCKDNGKDYYRKGTAYINYIHPNVTEIIPTSGSIQYSQTDYCENENLLREYFCHDDGSVDIGSTNYWCPFGCQDGACLKISPDKNFQPIDINEKIDTIANETLKNEIKQNIDYSIICKGCVLDSKCYPYGFRKDGNYCSNKDNLFIGQIRSENFCQNSFECDSNLCVNNSCVSGSLWVKIIRWFSHLFGK